MEVSEAQIKVIDGLIRGEIKPEKANKRTMAALVEKGLVKDGMVTQEGLKYTNVGVVEVDVITFGSDVRYTHPYWLDAEKTKIGRVPLNFPKGTEMIVTFAIKDKKYGFVYEGMIQVNGKPIWVRM